MLTPENALTFMLAGNAVVTFVSTATGNRFTYRIKEKEIGEDTIYFVSVLTGDDNTIDYTFMGAMFDNGLIFRHGKKSSIAFDAMSVKAFAWVFHRLIEGIEGNLKEVDIHHEGYCGRCRRTLTVPESIESGFGPVCRPIAENYIEVIS